MGIIDTVSSWFSNKPVELKLAPDMTRSKMTMPKAPMLDVSYESLLRYSRRSELVYACIEKKAQAACDAELVVERRNSKDEWERVKMHPLVSLLNKPNPYDDGESFRRAWIASENFADYFFCEIVRSRAGQPVELYPLNPVYLTAVYKGTFKGDVLDYYAYTINGREVRFKPEELLIRRRHGLGSILSNVSPVSIALGSVDADIAQTEYVRAFFNNDGTPSGILKVSGRNLTDTEADALKQGWRANYSRNGKNRGGIAVLDERADYQTVGAKLNELNSDSLTSIIESRICMAFGVPPILIGAYVGLLHVNQRASVREAQEDFWMNTMSPELKSIRSFLTWNLLPMFEPIEQIQAGNIRVNWDMSQVEALQDDLDDLYKRVGEAVKYRILTPNEARSKIGFDAIEGGDELVQPQGAFGQDEEVKQLNAAPETKAENIIEAEIIEEPEKKTFEFEGITLSRPPTELEQTLNLKKMLDDLESDRGKLSKVLSSLRESLIDEAVKLIQSLSSDAIHELILTPPVQIYKKVRRILESAFARGKEQIKDELEAQGADVRDFESLADEAIDEITNYTVSRSVNEMQTRAVNETVSLRLLGEVDVRSELGKNLREQSDKWIDGVSVSSVNAATQAGRREAITQFEDGWSVLEYSAILDANLCPNCKKWDGKRAQALADLPDTPNPSCEGKTRCRCFIVAIYDES